MRYRNVPTSVVSSQESEGKEFLVLLGGVAAIFIVLVTALGFAAGHLAPLIPFAAERSLAQGVPTPVTTSAPASDEARAAEAQLNDMVARLAAVMDLPQDMTLTVHYVDAPTVNAMATLGGHLFVFRGLLEKLESEEALAAVLAHEIGHVRERHVIRAMGRGVAIVGVLSALGINNRGLTQWAMGQGTKMAALSYSRDAERQADRAALAASHRVYGHVGGVVDVFDLFARETQGGIEMMQTHPLPASRVEEVKRLAAELNYTLDGERHALPSSLAAVSAPALDETP